VGDLTADTEVREQNSPLRGTRGHKNVGQLHIAVKQTPLMGKIQGVGDRIDDRHDVCDRHRHGAGEEVRRVGPIDEWHLDIDKSVAENDMGEKGLSCLDGG